MIYSTPAAFRHALEARLQKTAADRDQPIARVRQQVVFERFLARVFTTLGDRVALKGGFALELRLERARATRDVDLRITGRPDALHGALQRSCELDLSDFFSFAVAPDPKHPKIDGSGIVYEGLRYRVEAQLAGKIYGDRFGLDVGFGDVLTAPAELRQGSDFLAFAGVAPSQLRLYPREAHVAEKLHAYTLPRARENSRVKDLPDLALLATTGQFASIELHRAIEATFTFRLTHTIPAVFPEPPSSWTASYAKLADVDRLPWRDLAALKAAVKTFLDPVLAGTVGVWDPSSWSWKPLQQEAQASRRLRR